jgi:hypothetical protein
MKRDRIIELITDPTKNFLTSFLVGTLLFTVISDGLSALFWETFGDWLQVQLGIENKALLQAATVTILTLLILLVIYAPDFPQWLKPLIAKFPIFGIKVPDDTNVLYPQARELHLCRCQAPGIRRISANCRLYRCNQINDSGYCPRLYCPRTAIAIC